MLKCWSSGTGPDVALGLYLGPIDKELWLLGRLHNLFWASVPSTVKRGVGVGDMVINTSWDKGTQTGAHHTICTME